MLKRFTMILMSCMFILGTWMIVKPEKAYACSCAMPASVSDEMDRKTAIFSGKVLSVVNPEQKEIMSSADPVTITFEVDTVWKGQLEENTIVQTAESSASCGYDGFAESSEYIVYAYGEPDKLETGMCERTKLLDDASEDLTALGKGYAPNKTTGSQGSSEPSETDGSSGTPVAGDNSNSIVSSESSYIIPLVGLVIIIAFVFMLFTFRRRKS
ncbi:hypothetical protein [Cohnella sp. WQ 127256]|uniref:hypothetical protein n=1 Tax=Cohnella sp. WQ 127256 TaxID=2938790 RepID=UPI00211957AD|nr:hypothetical protein [Cohnella sp. WQ 127256]